MRPVEVDLQESWRLRGFDQCGRARTDPVVAIRVIGQRRRFDVGVSRFAGAAAIEIVEVCLQEPTFFEKRRIGLRPAPSD